MVERASWEAFGLCVKSLDISCNHQVPSPIGSEPCVFCQVLQSSPSSLVLCSLYAFNTVCGALPCWQSEEALASLGATHSVTLTTAQCSVLGGENQNLSVWNLINLGTVQHLPPTPPPRTCKETPTNYLCSCSPQPSLNPLMGCPPLTGSQGEASSLDHILSSSVPQPCWSLPM